MLVRFKYSGEPIYINPDQVFEVRKYSDEKTAIWSSNENNYTIVDEPLDRVAMLLSDAMRR